MENNMCEAIVAVIIFGAVLFFSVGGHIINER